MRFEPPDSDYSAHPRPGLSVYRERAAPGAFLSRSRPACGWLRLAWTTSRRGRHRRHQGEPGLGPRSLSRERFSEPNGASSFANLQRALWEVRDSRLVYDLLELNGLNLRSCSLLDVINAHGSPGLEWQAPP
jgi:hypothetical protein